jgi:hypothetical protein
MRRGAKASAVVESNPETAHLPGSVAQTLHSPGEPLDAAVRAPMEARFGRKFGDVRVHTGAVAAESAQAVNALAYTVGSQIVFRQGQYQPGSAKGRHLLAHELAHVVQQAGATKNPSRPLAIGGPDTTAEIQAEQAARTLSSSPPRLDRQELSVARTAFHPRRELADNSMAPEDCDWKEPDDDAVASIIVKTLGGPRGNRYTANKLWNAWQDVHDQREKPDGSNCCDADLAAAEHYFYARYGVTNKDYTPFGMKTAIWGYAFFKVLFPRSGICPKSPNSASQRKWGYNGSDDAANCDMPSWGDFFNMLGGGQ